MTDSEAESAQQLMRKAVTLGYKGQGLTSPNPPVGAVIARDGIVLGEGYHRRCGDAHAELLAIAEAQSKGGGGSARCDFVCDLGALFLRGSNGSLYESDYRRWNWSSGGGERGPGFQASRKGTKDS